MVMYPKTIKHMVKDNSRYHLFDCASKRAPSKRLKVNDGLQASTKTIQVLGIFDKSSFFEFVASCF